MSLPPITPEEAALLRKAEERLYAGHPAPQLGPDAFAELMDYWPTLQKELGLDVPSFDPEAPRGRRRQHSRDALLAEFQRVATVLGRIPTWIDLDRHARMAPSTFKSRLGNMPEILKAHAQWLAARRNPASPAADSPPQGGPPR